MQHLWAFSLGCSCFLQPASIPLFFQTGRGFASAWRASVHIWICITVSRLANLLACCPPGYSDFFIFFLPLAIIHLGPTVCHFAINPISKSEADAATRGCVCCRPLWAPHPFVSRLWRAQQLDAQQHPPSSLCHCLCRTSTCPHFMLKYGSSGCMVRKHAVGTFL